MGIFLLAYAVSVVVGAFGVSHNEKRTREKPKAMLSKTDRQQLVTLFRCAFTRWPIWYNLVSGSGSRQLCSSLGSRARCINL